MPRYGEVALFAMMASFWAMNYVLLKFALLYEDPVFILAFRIGIAAAISTVAFGRFFSWPRGLKLNLSIFAFSMLNIVMFMTLWFLGEKTVSASLSSILVYTYPLFTVLFSRIFLGETLNRRIILGLIVGFAGVVITFSGSFISGDRTGAVLLILAAISWASGTIYYKRYLSKENSWTVNVMQYAYSFPVILAVAILTEPFSVSGVMHYQFIFTVIYMGSFGTAAAYFIYLYLFRHYKASSISSFFFAVPALSIVFSFLLRGQTESPVTLIGFLVISVGIYLGSGSVKRET